MLNWLRQLFFASAKGQRAYALGWVRYNPNATVLDDKSVRVLGLLVIETKE